MPLCSGLTSARENADREEPQGEPDPVYQPARAVRVRSSLKDPLDKFWPTSTVKIREKQNAGPVIKVLTIWLNDGLSQLSEILYDNRHVKAWFHKFEQITEVERVIY